MKTEQSFVCNQKVQVKHCKLVVGGHKVGGKVSVTLQISPFLTREYESLCIEGIKCNGW